MSWLRVQSATGFAAWAMAAAEAPADTAARDLLPFRATERTLPNGLKVIVVPTGFPNLVSLQIPVKTGSRNEIEPGKSGFAHFFEHMMFRGTPTYPPERYQDILTRAGARQNAYTSDDFTNYHTTFAKEDLETILEIEADRFQHLSYPEAAFKTEARAVLGEYNKNSAEPLNKLIEVQREHAFTRHPYRHTTMGFLKDVEDMPNQLEYSRVFFERWYRPEHATVIVAGDVTPEAVMPLVEKYWGPWKTGSYKADIPAEPEPAAPVSAHVPWTSETLPWVTVAFHGPAFSEEKNDFAAMDAVLDLSFGETSALYKRLVEVEQLVDQLVVYFPPSEDPNLATVLARVKKPDAAARVRDEILRTFVAAREAPVSPSRLADAKSNGRYGLLRTLDNTEAIGALLARFVRFRRSYDTLNRLYGVYDALTPADLQAVAVRYFTDARLVQTTLSHDPLPPEVAAIPKLATLAARSSGAVATLVLPSVLPQLDVKLLFRAGSAHDPKGKEGLAALAAAMIAEAGSRDRPIDEIRKVFFPMAASFTGQVDKEMTTFTGRVHRDNWDAFAAVALPMLTEPGFREEDFKRLKDQQMNALQVDLRSSNDEELGKERLQANLFADTPYGHPVLGTAAGIESITLRDVQEYVGRAYTRVALKIGLSGSLPSGLEAGLGRLLAPLAEGPALPEPTAVRASRPKGITVEIVQKETRATAISIGHPIEVTRKHPDFVALYLARTWLGEHRSSVGRLYDRIREKRGLNYGDYAYIEAFPRGMFQFLPDPNLARRAQIFEAWIRPVAPENAHFALRLALFELRRLTREGLTPTDFESTRNYLMKSVFLMTATQDQQLGYALDSDWYGLPEFTRFMRDGLSRLTLADVNAAVRRHLSGDDLHVVMITKDAAGLRDALMADAPSRPKYDAEKPKEILDEDAVVGVLKLGIRSEAVRITAVEDVFAR